MKHTTITISLYDFNELSEQAKQKAIEEHRNFLLSIMSRDDFISGDPNYDTPDELEKAFNTEYDYYLMNDEPIIENIEANEYMFYSSGELAHVKEYVSGYGEKNRKKFLVFNDNEIELKGV